MKAEDASRGSIQTSSQLTYLVSPLLARPVERGVAANLIIFIVVVGSAMGKNSLFIHKHYTPDNSVTANRNASSRNLTDT